MVTLNPRQWVRVSLGHLLIKVSVLGHLFRNTWYFITYAIQLTHYTVRWNPLPFAKRTSIQNLGKRKLWAVLDTILITLESIQRSEQMALSHEGVTIPQALARVSVLGYLPIKLRNLITYAPHVKHSTVRWRQLPFAKKSINPNLTNQTKRKLRSALKLWAVLGCSSSNTGISPPEGHSVSSNSPTRE